MPTRVWWASEAFEAMPLEPCADLDTGGKMTEDVLEVDTSRVNEAMGSAQYWHSIDWTKAEADVKRLRQRIFRATQEKDFKKVRNLQKLMLRSHANTVVSIRRVTQRSMGRRTAGVDGFIASTDEARGKLARTLAQTPLATSRPARRVYIPKANGKMRPLGIPTIRDRVEQARVKNALEPEWEARFDGRSFGFRPGRGCHDALVVIHKFLTGRNGRRGRPWVLDADLTSAFDRINHDCLMDAIGDFPARREIYRWLKAGVMERGQFAPTGEGTPQGGVISPLLLNIALHGMREIAGDATDFPEWKRVKLKSPILVRYADDFVVICATEKEAYEAKSRLADWLAPRGLSINEEKTRVVHVDEGFDFLGCKVQAIGRSILIKPSQKAIESVKGKIRELTSPYNGLRIETLIRRMNALIKGWAMYHRPHAASKTFGKMDSFVYQRMYRWAKRQHAQKGAAWVKAKYFGRLNPTRMDKWVFGDKKTGQFLEKFAWTRIQRHVMVKGDSSPDDPSLREYWATRTRQRPFPPREGKISVSLAAKQKGLCPLCGVDLITCAPYEPDSPREWAEWFDANARTINRHHLTYRSMGGSDKKSNLVLIHADCHRQHHADDTRIGPRRIPKT